MMAAAAAVSAAYGGKPAPITLVLNAGHHSNDSAATVTQESLFQHLNINVLSQVQCLHQSPPARGFLVASQVFKAANFPL
jgi:hypothetical protein